MHWFTIIMIGVAANIDNLGIGVTFGARSTKVPLLSNLLIASLSMAATYVSMTAGWYLSRFFDPFWGNLVGGLVIVLLGVWGIRSIVAKRRRSDRATDSGHDIAERSDKNNDHIISWTESISLGFALSVNCIASSLGAGASGVSPLLATVSVGLFSLISIDWGVRLGSGFAKSWLGRYSELLGCVLLIAIGFYEMAF